MTEPLEPILDPYAGLFKAVRAAIPPLVTQFARWSEDFGEQLRPSIDAIAAAQRAVALALPPRGEIVELLERIAEGSRWVNEAPKALQAALAGKTVVHQELSLPDIGAIIRAFNEDGADAALAKVQELHEEILVDVKFRDGLRARWECADRLQIMSEVLATYDAGFYFVAIPPALAQAEGIVAEFFGLTDLRFPELKQRVRELHTSQDGDPDLFEPLVMTFLEGLLVRFEHGKPVLQLNRHAVQHGGDKAYGTKANAVAAIIWADYLLGVTLEAKAKREATTPTDADERE